MNELSILKWYSLAGITDIISEQAINRFKQPVVKPVAPVQNTVIDENNSFTQKSVDIANQSKTLDELIQNISSVDYIPFKKTATHTFTGVGIKQNPQVMCIFDVPRRDADLNGDLFKCPMGELLRKMLNAIALTADTNTYIAPLIPWRLPGDRKPTDAEIQMCVPFIKKQIELIQPKVLVFFSSVVVKSLLQIDSISKARLQKLNYNNIPVFVTFGPEMVSQSQISRTNAWADLQKIEKYLKEN